MCELDLEQEVEWAADYFPILDSERRPDGRLRVRLATYQRLRLVRLVLRLAPAAEPVSTPELPPRRRRGHPQHPGRRTPS